jgi:rubrerythrin
MMDGMQLALKEEAVHGKMINIRGDDTGGFRLGLGGNANRKPEARRSRSEERDERERIDPEIEMAQGYTREDERRPGQETHDELLEFSHGSKGEFNSSQPEISTGKVTTEDGDDDSIDDERGGSRVSIYLCCQCSGLVNMYLSTERCPLCGHGRCMYCNAA